MSNESLSSKRIDDAVNVCKQPRRLDPTRVGGVATAVVLDHLHELDERVTLLQEYEHESFGFPLAFGREYFGLVADVRQPEAKNHRTIVARTARKGSTDS